MLLTAGFNHEVTFRQSFVNIAKDRKVIPDKKTTIKYMNPKTKSKERKILLALPPCLLKISL